MGYVSLIDGHIENAEHCVCCGRVIPEGRQHCIICGKIPKKKRQIDRIKNMSVEELAQALYSISNCLGMKCEKCILHDANCMDLNSIKQYLESEVDTE